MRFLVSRTVHNNGGSLCLFCRNFAVIGDPFAIYKRFKLVFVGVPAALLSQSYPNLFYSR